ncbi:MAG: hypothetical protein KIT57_10425 [Blastocatellales bacterium]|nr:hypothetical protein [Blastocatellales bacterium]
MLETDDHPLPATPTLRQIAARASLFNAWRKVRANRGAAGIDAVSLQTFERKLDANLAELSRNLLNRTYEPLPARFVGIPKTDGKLRELAIPAVRDRIAQRAALDIMEPLFEPIFLDCSYAYRPGRSVEMAVQSIVVARAQGFRWVVESDILDFFPSIDNQILIDSISRVVDDRDLLRLLRQWLDAGALGSKSPTDKPPFNWAAAVAETQMAAREAFDRMIGDALADRLAADSTSGWPDSDYDSNVNQYYETSPGGDSRSSAGTTAIVPKGGTALRRLFQDGVLLALAHRGLLRQALGLKMLGIGGLAAAAALAAPPLIRKLRQSSDRWAGTLQGAPISPLLSNVYLHSFDQELTRQGLRLIRYCDDFILLCRTEDEALSGRQLSEETLRRLRLRLHPDKTRILSPAEDFAFLGYKFTADCGVIPPPTIPQTVRNRVLDFAQRAQNQARRRKSGAESTNRKPHSNWFDRWKNRLNRPG